MDCTIEITPTKVRGLYRTKTHQTTYTTLRSGVKEVIDTLRIPRGAKVGLLIPQSYIEFHLETVDPSAKPEQILKNIQLRFGKEATAMLGSKEPNMQIVHVFKGIDAKIIPLINALKENGLKVTTVRERSLELISHLNQPANAVWFDLEPGTTSMTVLAGGRFYLHQPMPEADALLNKESLTPEETAELYTLIHEANTLGLGALNPLGLNNIEVWFSGNTKDHVGPDNIIIDQDPFIFCRALSKKGGNLSADFLPTALRPKPKPLPYGGIFAGCVTALLIALSGLETIKQQGLEAEIAQLEVQKQQLQPYRQQKITLERGIEQMQGILRRKEAIYNSRIQWTEFTSELFNSIPLEAIGFTGLSIREGSATIQDQAVNRLVSISGESVNKTGLDRLLSSLEQNPVYAVDFNRTERVTRGSSLIGWRWSIGLGRKVGAQ